MSKKWLGILTTAVILLASLSSCAPRSPLQETMKSASKLEVWRQDPLTGAERLAVTVTDRGILTGLSSLLKQAQRIESSAQSPEYCDLVILTEEASTIRMPVYSNDAQYTLSFREALYTLPETFMPSLDLLDQLPEASGQIADEDQQLLTKYHQSAVYQIAKYQLTLPTSFLSKPGAMPLGAYWCASNALSRDIGLDFSALLGETVEVNLYKLSGAVDMEAPFHNKWSAAFSRAVILHLNGKIVGAWLDTGPGIGCSMDGSCFTELESQGEAVFSELVSSDGASASMTPEDLIAAYFTAIDAKDYARAHSLEDNTLIMKRYMFEGAGFDQLYQQQFPEIAGRQSGASLSVWRSSRLTRLSPMTQQDIDFYYEYTPLPSNARAFLVWVDADWDPDNLSGDMSTGVNEMIVATWTTLHGERILDMGPR